MGLQRAGAQAAAVVVDGRMLPGGWVAGRPGAWADGMTGRRGGGWPGGCALVIALQNEFFTGEPSFYICKTESFTGKIESFTSEIESLTAKSSP